MADRDMADRDMSLSERFRHGGPRRRHRRV